MSKLPVEERASARVEASFRVQYLTVDELVVAYASDLSRGGLFLATEQFLPLNAVVRVHLELPHGSGEIAVICRVVFLRDREGARQAGSEPGMGLEFLDLGADGLALLEQFIIELGSGGPVDARPPAPRRLSVVVVDDEPHARQEAAAPFIARGDDVRTATDGFEALALCLKHVPDVLLTDVQMPRLDGWQLLRMVRARPSLSSVPVLFLTTLAGEHERLHGYQLGVDDYVAKPYQAEELLVRVDRLLLRTQRSGPPLVAKKTLRGDLEQVSLPSLLSFLEGERKTGELLILGERRASLLLHEGQLLTLELDGWPAPDPAIFEVLGWSSGQFEFAAREVDGGEEPRSPTALILEYARRLDQSRR
jgi:uncharacterized protein (TIGR02266 family)